MRMDKSLVRALQAQAFLYQQESEANISAIKKKSTKEGDDEEGSQKIYPYEPCFLILAHDTDFICKGARFTNILINIGIQSFFSNQSPEYFQYSQ